MATLNDVYKKFPEMKETIESMNGTVAVANKNPSPDEIIAGIKTIKTGSDIDGKTITKNAEDQLQAVGLLDNDTLLTANDIYLATTIDIGDDD